jgi:hypothetical protein
MASIAIRYDRTVVSEGMHNAVLGAAVDVGLQPGYKDGPPRRQHVYFFEIEGTDGPDGETQRMAIRMTDSLYSKSRLYAAVRALKGGLTAEEVATNTFDPESLVGRPCTVQVEHYKGDDGTPRARIIAVLPHDKRNPVLKPMFSKSDIPDWVLELRDEALAEN